LLICNSVGEGFPRTKIKILAGMFKIFESQFQPKLAAPETLKFYIGLPYLEGL